MGGCLFQKFSSVGGCNSRSWGLLVFKNHEECMLVDVDLQNVNSFEHFCQQRGALHYIEKFVLWSY